METGNIDKRQQPDKRSAVVYQSVFNISGKSLTWRRALSSPFIDMNTSSVKNERYT